MNEVAADSIARLDRGGKDLAAIANLVGARATGVETLRPGRIVQGSY